MAKTACPTLSKPDWPTLREELTSGCVNDHPFEAKRSRAPARSLQHKNVLTTTRAYDQHLMGRRTSADASIFSTARSWSASVPSTIAGYSWLRLPAASLRLTVRACSSTNREFRDRT